MFVCKLCIYAFRDLRPKAKAGIDQKMFNSFQLGGMAEKCLVGEGNVLTIEVSSSIPVLSKCGVSMHTWQLQSIPSPDCTAARYWALDIPVSQVRCCHR